MPSPSTRITRKNLREPDQFLVTTGRVVDYIQKHRSQSIAVLAGLLLLGLALVGWSLYRERQIQQAATSFSQALARYRSGNSREALAGFEATAKYRSTTLGRYAMLYQANSHLELKEPEAAIKVLETLVARETSPTLLRQLALMTLGHAHESRGQWQQAAEVYGNAEKIAGPYKEYALLNKARTEGEAQDYKAALNSYQTYLKNYPNSIRSGEVALQVQKLEPMAGRTEK